MVGCIEGSDIHQNGQDRYFSKTELVEYQFAAKREK